MRWGKYRTPKDCADVLLGFGSGGRAWECAGGNEENRSWTMGSYGVKGITHWMGLPKAADA